MEARESQRDIMRLAALDGAPLSDASSAHTAADSARPFLDLAARHRGAPSTVTSLESLASSIDLRDDAADKNLKRNRDLIMSIDKESQVKEQRGPFRGLFPAGDASVGSPKKSRVDDL